MLIRYNVVPTKLTGESQVELKDQVSGDTELRDFKLFFLQPHRTLPSFMIKNREIIPQVDLKTFQSSQFRSYFSVGDTIARGNSIAGLMEDCHSVSANIALQQWCDDNSNNLYNYVAPRTGYQKTPIFERENKLFFIEEEDGKYLNPGEKATRTRFYNYMFREYKYFFKYSAESKWLGRRGFHKLDFDNMLKKNYLEEMKRTPHTEVPYAIEVI